MVRLEFVPQSTPIHKWHPLIKLLGCVVFIVLATMSYDPVPNIVLFALTLVMALVVSRLSVRRFFSALLPFTVIALGFGIAQILFHGEGTTLLAIGPLSITQEGAYFAGALAFRMLVIISISLVFTLTTDPRDLVLSLIQQLRLNYRIAFGIFFALRMIPQVEAEFDIIRSAHRIRGVGERAGLLGMLEEYRRYTIPLLVGLIRKSTRAAMAMESKAFGAFPERTYLHKVYIHKKDTAIFLALVIVLSAVMWILWRAGLLRGLILTTSTHL
ncbi:MAG TPA: energy-coupling factor transporter transmembrane protein EcfT [Anaerolineae bacterium]|nr:energy-coupling factor transporter transmembrane protein EcfT [Anaerolineae bacterium]